MKSLYIQAKNILKTIKDYSISLTSYNLKQFKEKSYKTRNLIWGITKNSTLIILFENNKLNDLIIQNIIKIKDKKKIKKFLSKKINSIEDFSMKFKIQDILSFINDKNIKSNMIIFYNKTMTKIY